MRTDEITRIDEFGIFRDSHLLFHNGPADDGALLRKLLELAKIVRDRYTETNSRVVQATEKLSDFIAGIESGVRKNNEYSKAKQIVTELASVESDHIDVYLAAASISEASNLICDAAENGRVVFDAPQQWVCLGIEIGRLVARLEVRPARKFITAGQRQIMDRPRAMRDAKAIASAKKQRENRQSAEEALKCARQAHPTAAADGKISFLKLKAAEQLGINVSTLNRRLRKCK